MVLFALQLLPFIALGILNDSPLFYSSNPSHKLSHTKYPLVNALMEAA
ncbi:hypothetical protein SAMN04487897_11843 [Paenibacillus sp. yr247]|nr:hypothetical protein SAMN04487897_11843 [Paenibacillus sp. yr247]